jgi:YebC/PmpR family DNA-binding regulatory protein
MAGHSKWSNIKHRKGAQDAKRGKIFTKLIKEITISSRIGGGVLSSNPRLRKAVSKAKASNLALDKIDRAIKKGTGELEGIVYEEMVYEGFGPSGVSIILEIITDNKNRSVAEIRHLLTKYGGNLGENGSVMWMFEKKGIIILDVKCGTEEDIMNLVIECGAQDFKNEDGSYTIHTVPEQVVEVSEMINKAGFELVSSEVELIPKTLQIVNESESDPILRLLDELNDNDDVNKLYTNFKIGID